MKRVLIIALTTMMLASLAGVALADDEGAEAEEATTELQDKAMLAGAQLDKAALLAEYYAGEDGDLEASQEEIIAARIGETLDHAIGWGALYKLLRLARADGMTLTEYLESLEGEGFAFGKRFKELDETQWGLIEGDARNLGQLKKQQREADEEPVLESTGFSGDSPSKGKANKAKGKNKP